MQVKVTIYADDTWFYGVSIMRMKESVRKAWLDARGYPYTSHVDEFGDTIYVYTVPDRDAVTVTEINGVKADAKFTSVPLKPLTIKTVHAVDDGTSEVDEVVRMWNDEHPHNEGGV